MNRVRRAVDPGEHQQAGQPSGMGALDVGIKPVADHQGRPGVPPEDRVGQQLRRGLARDPGFGAGGCAQCRHQGAVAGQQAPLGGQGRVDVGRDPQRAGTDGQGCLGQIRPADCRGQALHDGNGSVVVAAHRAQPDRSDLVGERLGAHDQHRCIRRQQAGQQAGRGLGAGDDVVAAGGEAEIAQVRGDLVGAAGGVVGDVQLAGAHLHQRLYGAGGRSRAAEHRPVQVEQQAVVGPSQAGHGWSCGASSSMRSSASVAPSTSAAAECRNHCRASSVRPSASSVSA